MGLEMANVYLCYKGTRGTSFTTTRTGHDSRAAPVAQLPVLHDEPEDPVVGA